MAKQSLTGIDYVASKAEGQMIASGDTTLTPFIAQRPFAFGITLLGDWMGTVRLLRSHDAAESGPNSWVEVAGTNDGTPVEWTFNTFVIMPEVEQYAWYALRFTRSSGTLKWRIAQ